MTTYYGFLVLIVVVSCVAYRLSNWKSGRFHIVWLGLSLLLGLVGSWIPWREASGFHYGKGTPLPSIIWERRSDGGYDDFPGFTTLFLNPIAVFLIGAVCWLVIFVARRCLRRHPDPA